MITRRGNRPKQRTDLSVVAVGLRAGRGISRLLARARWQGHELRRSTRSATRRLRTRPHGRRREPHGSERTTALSSVNAPERACSSATLGLRPKLGPRFPRCPARNHLRGTFKVESGQSSVRLVWASPARSGHSYFRGHCPKSSRSSRPSMRRSTVPKTGTISSTPTSQCSQF